MTYRNAATTAATNKNTTSAVVFFLSPVPFYGTIIISAACLVLFICCFCCLILRCREQRKAKRMRKDLVKLRDPGAGTSKELVQPDLLNYDDIDGEKPPEFRGKLQYSMEYSVKDSKLTVMVIEARDLKAMDIGGTSDPYVKVRLNPNKKPVFCTKIVKSNCNPLFNETFAFDVESTNLASRTLSFHVFDHDAIGSDDLIGIISVPLATRNLSAQIIEWEDLNIPGDDDVEKVCGDICVSLRYISASALLNVVILEAKNLPTTEENDDPDTFVKITLKHDNKRLKKKKTTVRKASINPYFNETFIFDLPLRLVKNVTLEITVSTPLRIRSKRIGYVEIGSNVNNAREALHWADMLANPRQPTARWHKLHNINQDS